MLGFGKKKKKEDNEAASPEQDSTEASDSQAEGKSEPSPKKRRFSLKKIGIIFIVLGFLGGGGYAGFTFFFSSPDPETKVYDSKFVFTHIKLPQEMLRFSFDHFQDLYFSFIEFEKEMGLFENEIQRIEAVAVKYPEQKKIADGQKKVWEKGKNKLLKEFEKLEKPVKEAFVLFQVNPAQGKEQIQAKATDLAASARAALDTAAEQTAALKARLPQAPDGMIQGTLFKLKKKFL